VQNSAGTNAFQIQDDLNANFGSSLQVKGQINSGGLTLGDVAYYGAKYVDLISNLPGGGTRGGLRWVNGYGSSTGEIVSDRKFSGGQDFTMCFRVKGTELMTMQEATSSGVSTMNVGINNTNPNVTAILDVASTTKGFLPPRGTNAQMLAIVSPAEGLVFYDLTNHKLNVFDGTSWVAMH
jgi:hypothetical protein